MTAHSAPSATACQVQTIAFNNLPVFTMKAIWNNKVLAESNETMVIENNHYFPAESVNKEYFKESDTQTACVWKGTASYYDIEVDGQVNKDAAWYYPDPMDQAKPLKDMVAFWKGVEVTE